MTFEPARADRAVGAVTGAATGDALGVGYEFAARLDRDVPAGMIGGGVGGHTPGEWSDDTAMATAILDVAATGADLRSPGATDAVAAGFLRWLATDPPDVGRQTRAVLGAIGDGPGVGTRMLDLSRDLHGRGGRTGGNGSLMRTSPVALAHLGEPDAVATAARTLSDLTHADPMAGDACVLWSVAIEHAIRTGECDVRVGLDRVDPSWREFLDEAEAREPHELTPNGWVVAALQAAWSAITRSDSLESGLQAAVHAGHDTDTVAAIAGGLLGATYGDRAIPDRWRRLLHGHPGYRHADLARLALQAVG